MTQTWNDSEVPAESDPWNLVTDLRKLADNSNRVIPVADKAERNALAASAPGGIPEGTLVLRLDQSANTPTFDQFVNGAWVDGDTGWIQLTLQNGWSSSTGAFVRRRGGTVRYRGQINNTTVVGDSVAFQAPAGFRTPGAVGTQNYPITSNTAANFAARIGGDGVCTMWTEFASSAARSLAGIFYDID